MSSEKKPSDDAKAKFLEALEKKKNKNRKIIEIIKIYYFFYTFFINVLYNYKNDDHKYSLCNMYFNMYFNIYYII